MHNIKDIRSNFDIFKNTIKSRNISIDLNKILDLDQKNRKLNQEKESLEQEKKSISKKQDKSLFTKSKEISEKIISINKDQNAPIFEIADYAVIGDLLEIVPKLIEKIKNN